MTTMKESIVIVIMMTACLCMVMSSLSGGAGLFLAQSMVGQPTTLGLDAGESVTYDNIPRATDGCVVLYEQPDGGGNTVTYCLEGKHKVAVKNLKTYDFNDMASAMDIGPGVKVKLFKDSDLRGVGRTFGKNEFITFSDVSYPQDTVSSLTLTKT